jgi:hypothetical protein
MAASLPGLEANLDEIGGWITEQLPALVAEYKVPGAAIGVYRSGEVFDFTDTGTNDDAVEK